MIEAGVWMMVGPHVSRDRKSYRLAENRILPTLLVVTLLLGPAVMANPDGAAASDRTTTDHGDPPLRTFATSNEDCGDCTFVAAPRAQGQHPLKTEIAELTSGSEIIFAGDAGQSQHGALHFAEDFASHTSESARFKVSAVGVDMPGGIILDYAVGDVTGDFRNDILALWRPVTESDERIRLYTGTSNGFSRQGIDVHQGGDILRVAVGQLDGQGPAEVITSSPTVIRVLRLQEDALVSLWSMDFDDPEIYRDPSNVGRLCEDVTRGLTSIAVGQLDDEGRDYLIVGAEARSSRYTHFGQGGSQDPCKPYVYPPAKTCRSRPKSDEDCRNAPYPPCRKAGGYATQACVLLFYDKYGRWTDKRMRVNEPLVTVIEWTDQGPEVTSALHRGDLVDTVDLPFRYTKKPHGGFQDWSVKLHPMYLIPRVGAADVDGDGRDEPVVRIDWKASISTSATASAA